MKKILVAAAIVCVAAVTQAATVTWSATALQAYNNGTPGKEENLNTMSAYLFTAATSEALASTISSLTTDLANGTFTGLSGKTEWVTNKSTANQIVATDTGDNTVSAGTLYGKMIIFDNTDASKATAFYVSNEATADVDAALGGLFTFGSQKTAGMNVASNWTTITSIPEPTSAMLLLLGVAGLALKRKQA